MSAPHRPNKVQVLFVGDSKKRWVSDKAINIDRGACFTVGEIYPIKWKGAYYDARIVRIRPPTPEKFTASKVATPTGKAQSTGRAAAKKLLSKYTQNWPRRGTENIARSLISGQKTPTDFTLLYFTSIACSDRMGLEAQYVHVAHFLISRQSRRRSECLKKTRALLVIWGHS